MTRIFPFFLLLLVLTIASALGPVLDTAVGYRTQGDVQNVALKVFYMVDGAALAFAGLYARGWPEHGEDRLIPIMAVVLLGTALGAVLDTFLGFETTGGGAGHILFKTFYLLNGGCIALALRHAARKMRELA
jgi:hypothetical protein